MMNIEVEVRDMKQHIIEISKKIDELLYEREVVSMMKLAETSISGFLESEPDIYTIEDLKARYIVSCKKSLYKFLSLQSQIVYNL